MAPEFQDEKEVKENAMDSVISKILEELKKNIRNCRSMTRLKQICRRQSLQWDEALKNNLNLPRKVRAHK
jgi:hypothetical protein